VAHIAAHVDEPITLHDLAAAAGTSRFHLQRTFTRLVGVSPRQYQEALRAERFRGSLRRGVGIADATYDAGYGSSSRVYEGRPTGRGVTPVEYRRGGQDVAIVYATAASPLGRVLVAATARGVCAVKLGDRDDALAEELRREYPLAVIERDAHALAPWVRRIVRAVRTGTGVSDIPLDVRGTAFQWKVWRYLQSIPAGETRTYGAAAAALGRPSASRAVARACATNPVGLVIPCHRMVPKAGGTGGYRWGVERKRQLLRKERQ
jgi:AraC family transcriptional regulator of adaptative response/methylated-DNA-[protein]-cysteine methyltransferase